MNRNARVLLPWERGVASTLPASGLHLRTPTNHPLHVAVLSMCVRAAGLVLYVGRKIAGFVRSMTAAYEEAVKTGSSTQSPMSSPPTTPEKKKEKQRKTAKASKSRKPSDPWRKVRTAAGCVCHHAQCRVRDWSHAACHGIDCYEALREISVPEMSCIVLAADTRTSASPLNARAPAQRH